MTFLKVLVIIHLFGIKLKEYSNKSMWTGSNDA